MPSGRGNAFAFLGLLTGLLWALAGTPALAQANDPLPAPPGGGFGLPVDCAMGSVCSIQNYIDHDPGPGWLDHTCGPLSYDGHRGIDFRIPTQIDMRRGVAVIAAADGEVVIAKDGQPDLLMADTGPGKTREARNGNWIAIRHGDGWVTTYAHLMKGTVAVRQGERVTRGQKLGLIGLSGNSDFPHVHFAVTHENRLLDPFTGQEPTAACGGADQNLWSPAARAQLAYRSGGLLSAGLLDRQAESEEIYAGIEPPASLSKESPVLIFWASLWGLREGDRLSLTVIAPNDAIVVTHAESLDKHRAQAWRWVGRKRPEQGWPVGRYRGILRVEREMGDASVIVVEAQREIEVR